MSRYLFELESLEVFIISSLFAMAIGFFGCQESNPNKKKIIDTGGFEIEVPANWKYKKERGIDSFVGRIVSNGVELSFDMSEMGYADHLIPNEMEFVYEDRDWGPIGIPYGEPGVIYTSATNVEAERERIMKEKGITDSSLVRVEKIQIPKEEIIIIKNEYQAILTYEDTTVFIKIEIPEETKKHLIQVDTINNYKRKLIRPRDHERGMTGVYFKDLKSDFNFNLVGENLSLENQEKAFNAFKTIKLKRR